MSENHHDNDKTHTHVPLAAGTTVSHYRVVEKIGAGGMGEVYLAEDTKLERRIALKFLLPYLCQDVDGRARFTREAQASASLNHPNIVTVHEVGEYQTRPYIAMEYLDGQSLREVVNEKNVNFERAIEYTAQICDGLTQAHKAGIVHRDIKPSNIYVGPNNVVKILDFGLAVSEYFDKITRTGSTLGTVDYMSPEQARGDDIDRRSDLFSVGVMLYELITGSKPFRRNNQIATLQAIVNDEPDPLTRFTSGAPGELQRIVFKLLSKKPDERYQHADDVAVDLRSIDVTANESEVIAGSTKTEIPGMKRGGILRLIPWGIATLALILAGWQIFGSRDVSTKPAMHFPIEIPDEYRLGTVLFNQIAISPDGSRWVTRVVDSTPKIHALLWEEGKPSPRLLEGSDQFRDLTFSPDGDWLLFFDQDRIKKLHIAGGEPVEVCEGGGFGTFWTPEDTIYYCRSISSGIWKISADGGEPQQVTEVADDEFAHLSPEVLSNGRGLLFTIWETSLKNISTALLDFETGEYRTLIKSGANARWVPTGHLVFIRQGTLMAVPFDLETLDISGSEVPVLSDVYQRPDVGIGDYAFSRTGLMIYQRDKDDTRRLVWADRQGVLTSMSFPPADYGFIRLSPDEKYLSFNKSHDGEINIWIMELATGRSRQVTFESENYAAIWHPGGDKIAFTTYRNGPFSVYEIPIDGSQPASPLIVRDVDVWADSYTPDGKFLLASMADEMGGDIWVFSLDDSTKSYYLIQGKYEQAAAEVYPGGQWVAYSSNESGQNEIYVKPLRGKGRGEQVSVNGGKWALWSPDGRMIYYWKSDKLMAATIDPEPRLKIGRPMELFKMENVVSYDIAADGRFIISVSEQIREPQIIAITNWFEELRRLTGGEE